MPWASGHVEVVTYGEPDPFGILAGVERLVDGPTAEHREEVVRGDGGRPGRAEMGRHQAPELGQPHAVTLLTGGGPTVRALPRSTS